MQLAVRTRDGLTRGGAWLAGAANRVAEAEHGRFAPFLGVAIAGGAALYYALPAEPAAASGVAALAAGGALAALWRSRWPALVLGLLVAAAGLGFALAQWATARVPPQPELPRRAAVVTGTVAMVEVLPKGRRLTLEAPRLDGAAALERRLSIRLRAGDPVAVATGDQVRVRAMLQPPGGAPLPGGWDIQFDDWHLGLARFG